MAGRLGAVLAATLVAFGAPAQQHAQQLEGAALVEALRAGGYSIYFRHAATDWGQADRVSEAGDWTSCDPDQMRQLSGEGRAEARRLGAAIRQLGIPVGRVLSSEYCRAAETARLMDLGPVETTRDIMNTRAAAYMGGREAVVRRARAALSEPPPEGANTVIVGHGNLMRAATGAYAAEGGSAIYAPMPGDGPGFGLVGRLSPADWVRLAQ